MSPFARALGRVAALILVAAVANADAPSLSDASLDEVKATRVIPDAARKVGEVRLLARGDSVVVQTLIATKLLERVIGEIRKKEEGNWPAGDSSMAAYLAALEKARDRIEKRDPGPDWEERRRRLLIEFAAGANDAAVMIGTFRTNDDAVQREVFDTLLLPRDYVVRNLRLIVADSWKVPEAEVDKVGPLGPASAATAASSTPGHSAPPATPPSAAGAPR